MVGSTKALYVSMEEISYHIETFDRPCGESWASADALGRQLRISLWITFRERGGSGVS
jgi:hypothetical protein